MNTSDVTTEKVVCRVCGETTVRGWRFPPEADPYCVLCGAQAENDDTACAECGGSIVGPVGGDDTETEGNDDEP